MDKPSAGGRVINLPVNIYRVISPEGMYAEQTPFETEAKVWAKQLNYRYQISSHRVVTERLRGLFANVRLEFVDGTHRTVPRKIRDLKRQGHKVTGRVIYLGSQVLVRYARGKGWFTEYKINKAQHIGEKWKT